MRKLLYLVATFLMVACGGRAAAQCMVPIGDRYSTTFTQQGDTVVLGVTLDERPLNIDFHCRRHKDGSLTVSGTVTDTQTKEELPYVYVSEVYEIYGEKKFMLSTQVAVTDGRGRFSFRRPALSHRTLAFHSLGYQPALFEEHWDTIAVSEREYLSLRDVSQRFDTAAVSREEHAELMMKHYEVFHAWPESQEYAWIESEGLQGDIGRFQPSGTLAVHVKWPVVDLRCIYLNGMLYTGLPADRLFTLSPEGLLATETPTSGNGHDNLHITLVDGYELQGFHMLELDSTLGVLTDLRWAKGGWLHFRTSSGRCYKLHVDMHPRSNCKLEDVEISEAEYTAAKAEWKRRNYTRTQHAPTATDSATVRRYEERLGSPWDLLGEDSQDVEFYHIDGTDIDIAEIAIGDGCCTFISGDTTEMQACRLALSHDGVFVGMQKPSDEDAPGYLYLFPLGKDRHSVKRTLIYQTTPEWFPTPYNDCFWGRDGWLYVEGSVGNFEKAVYHKVKLKQ